nr:hypothetical protein [Amycolatopsis benzoatilytica]
MSFVSAGYRVVQRPYSTDGSRDGLVSISECVVTVLEEEWGDWFRDPDRARHRAAESRLQVLEVGFTMEEAAPILRALLAEGYDRETHAVAGRLAEGIPINGTPLGYELVGYDFGTWHSWACLGGLIDDVRLGTGIEPGPHGLIRSADAAHTAARWLTGSGLGDPKVSDWAAAALFAR